jgi:transposase
MTRPTPPPPTRACASAGSRPSSRSRKITRTTAATAVARGRDRNTVELCFSKLRQFRAAATGYDKHKEFYQGTVDLASIRIWLRDPPT